LKRTAEHEQLIDELVTRTGLRRDVVEKATDKVAKHLVNALLDQAVAKVKAESIIVRHIGVIEVVEDTRRKASRFRENARSIRRAARLN
jgi:extradiol dioxygenase family protein